MSIQHPHNRPRLRSHRRRLITRSRRERRGVLMLVVLSILMLFLLIGTTFLVTSSAYQTASKVVEKAKRTSFQSEDVLERALMQLLRDTNNRHSVIRYHSLLRDLYGTDGFVGRIDTSEFPRYAGADPTVASDLGTTQGQVVEFYVSDFAGDYSTLDDANVVGLEFDSNGLPVEHTLSKTDAYYEGCLLTMLEGPCRGHSVRILDYDYLGVDTNGRPYSRLRVMAPRRLDGQALAFDRADGVLTDFIETATQGYRFMVNGRPFNGTGVGYNAYASPNAARLTALELFQSSANNFYGLERALIPNPTQYSELLNVFLDQDLKKGSDPLRLDPWEEDYSIDHFTSLTKRFIRQSDSNYDPAVSPLYKNFVGPGGADESYDAADFQNMFLALQALQPVPRGTQDPSTGVFNLNGLTLPSFHRPALANFWIQRLWNSAWLRSLISDDAIRMQAILQPYLDNGRPHPSLEGDQSLIAAAAKIAAIKRKFMLRPLNQDHPNFNGSNPFAPGGSSYNRESWEIVGPWDVDNDGDGVPDSVWVDLGLPIQKTEDGRFYKPLVAMLVEDLDGRLNLNAHGTGEHFVNEDLDASDNVATTNHPNTPKDNDWNANLAQDYNNLRPLQSSNQLPHGSGWGPADISLRSVLSPDLPFKDFRDGTELTGKADYDDYARLLVGRPDPQWVDPADPNDVARTVTSAVDVSETFGRYGSYPINKDPNVAQDSNFYRPGITITSGPSGNVEKPYRALASTVERRTPYDFAGYPEFASDSFIFSGFGERPDLFGRYATALNPLGQSVAEPMVDGRFRPSQPLLHDSPYELQLSNNSRRRSAEDLEAIINAYSQAVSVGGVAPINDDAPFSVGELERILRPYDSDVNRLPDRLWNLVDAFDPEKLAVQQAISNSLLDPNTMPVNWTPNSLQSLVAQSQAAVNRRQVTTESFDIPAPNENWTNRLILGADGLPGVPQVNDDFNNDSLTDEGDEAVIGDNAANEHTFAGATNAISYDDLFAAGCDDYLVVMGEDPPPNARITDYLRYRVVLELRRRGRPINDAVINNILFGDDTADASAVRSDLASLGGLVAPEVLAGLKMNLNRPFGDGLDNNNNGVVDEPQEAGEPFIDQNANGQYDAGEPFLNLDGDYGTDGGTDPNDPPYYDPPLDWVDLNGDGAIDLVNEAGRFDYTNGRDANGRGTVAGGARVQDDQQMARQLYARHLYCLMLAVMDENYLSPYDENDPQVVHYLDPDSRGGMAEQIKQALTNNPPAGYPWPGYSGNPKIDAQRIAMRKLTCRQVAQWAVNCVDMRDPDSIQTAFEYDENPWDGWNVVDTNGTTTINDDNILPLDGEVVTDENHSYIRQVTATGWTQDAADSDDDGDTTERVLRVLPTDDSISIAEHTRGVVWGAERPELLITEGIAWHDRRAQDRVSGSNTGDGKDSIDGGLIYQYDNDLDQWTRPKGGALLELFNPWSEDSLKPAELYQEITLANGDLSAGVALDRTSAARAVPRGLDGLPLRVDVNGYVDPSGSTIAPLRSPVWRLIAVEEHPLLRNTTAFKDPGAIDDPAEVYNQQLGPKRYLTNDLPQAYQQLRENRNSALNRARRYFDFDRDESYNNQEAPGLLVNFGVLLPCDPDFPSFDCVAQLEMDDFVNLNREVHNQDDPDNPETLPFYRYHLRAPNEYIERAFYFTGPAQRRSVNNRPVRDLVQPGLLVPLLAYDVRTPSGTSVDPGSTGAKPIREAIRTILGEEFDQFSDPTFTASKYIFTKGMQELRGSGGDPNPQGAGIRVFCNRYAPLDVFDADNDGVTSDETVPIAPILPGRYAVIGPAGVNFGATGVNPDDPLPSTELTDRFVVPMSWSQVNVAADAPDQHPNENTSTADLFGGGGGSQTNSPTKYRKTRRFELMPNDDPNKHQFVFRFNGGPDGSDVATGVPIARQTESVWDGTQLVNVTEPTSFDDPALPNPTNGFILPVVAIPIEGFNLSEPMDGYYVRQAELENTRDGAPLYWNTKLFPEGHYDSKTGDQDSADAENYDEPFDLQPELIANQTTPNYRTVHLQRLANPFLAWNPLPLRPNGEADPQHDPSRPVNPYLTIDSMPVDLTAFNGASIRETGNPGVGSSSSTSSNLGPSFPAITHTPPIDDPAKLHNRKRIQPDSRPNGGTYTNKAIPNIWFSSKEKGLFASVGDWVSQNIGSTYSSRDLFRQERQSTTNDIAEQMPRFLMKNPSQSAGGFGNAPQTDRETPIRDMATVDKTAAGGNYIPANFDEAMLHSFGFANRGLGAFLRSIDTVAGVAVNNIDINGDGQPRDLVGAPSIDTRDDDDRDFVGGPLDDDGNPTGDGIPDQYDTLINNNTMAAFHWPNRPFISETELMLAPIWNGTRMLAYYSTYNPDLKLTTQPNPYDGEQVENKDRWRNDRTPYGHLANFFATAAAPAQIAIDNSGDLQAAGAPHFYRILDYVHVPSRFIETDELLSPTVFAKDPASALDDPRRELSAPFNRVDHYREPGRINLNTVVTNGDPTEAADLWSEVYDGVMHRRKDASYIFYGNPSDPSDDELLAQSHLGPAWRDLMLSRRGYVHPNYNPTNATNARMDYSPRVLNAAFPTFFANPIRSSEGSFNVPLPTMQQGGVDASWLRAHPLSPGEDGAWGTRNVDNTTIDKSGDGPFNPDLDGLLDDSGEAGYPIALLENNDRSGGDIAMVREDGSLPDSLITNRILREPRDATTNVADSELAKATVPTPLFAGATTEPALNTERNPQLRYQPITRMANMATGRSGVFAVWITVGFFEVTPVTQQTQPILWSRYDLNNDGVPDDEDLFFSVYPEGYTLGKEVGIDTGENRRHRGFYMIDRTLPVAFKPGDDVNVEEAILLRRRIE